MAGMNRHSAPTRYENKPPVPPVVPILYRGASQAQNMEAMRRMLSWHNHEHPDKPLSEDAIMQVARELWDYNRPAKAMQLLEAAFEGFKTPEFIIRSAAMARFHRHLDTAERWLAQVDPQKMVGDDAYYLELEKGLLASHMDDYAVALKHFKKAHALNPDLTPAVMRIVRTYEELAFDAVEPEKYHEKAREAAVRWVEMEIRNNHQKHASEALMHQAMSEIRLGRMDDAFDTAGRVVELQREGVINHSYRYLLGAARVRQAIVQATGTRRDDLDQMLDTLVQERQFHPSRADEFRVEESELPTTKKERITAIEQLQGMDPLQLKMLTGVRNDRHAQAMVTTVSAGRS